MIFSFIVLFIDDWLWWTRMLWRGNAGKNYKEVDEELDSLVRNQTWDLVEFPAGKRVLHNKWVYRLKEEDGGKKRYKVRLVVKGIAQKKGVDFDEIFSPVVKTTSIRTILSLVVVEFLHIEQLDVKITLLHGDLEEEIYT